MPDADASPTSTSSPTSSPTSTPTQSSTVLRPGAAALLPRYAKLFLPLPGGPGVTNVLWHKGIRADAGHVARYARLVGEPDSEFLPLLYPHILGFDLQLALMADRAFPLRALGMVHILNEVVTTGRIRRDAVLDLAVNVTAPRPHPKGRVVDMLTVASTDGVAVWSETSTYLARGTGTPDAPSPGVDLDEGPTAGPGERPAGGRAERPAEGPADLHPSASWRLPADLGRRYGTLTGDVNPIHLYPLTAKAFGFPRQIVHGMWTAAAVAGALVNRMPDAVRFSVQFRRPLTLPCTAWLDTSVTTPTPAAAGAPILRARVRRADDVALVALARPA